MVGGIRILGAVSTLGLHRGVGIRFLWSSILSVAVGLGRDDRLPLFYWAVVLVMGRDARIQQYRLLTIRRVVLRKVLMAYR
jgi:hypothetical protein